MFIYNLSLICFFWLIFTFINYNFKTLHSFVGFSLNSFYLFLTTVVLFSMAGVPPFVGFFSKLFILILLTNSGFFLLYSLFFIVLFLGLYFYMQNIRFLHTSNHKSVDYQSIPLFNERTSFFFYYFSIINLLLIIFGTFYVDDIILIFTWIFS
jgi:NADH:ubiquinone oxidoreductase subunit 2 (subunit N)